MERTKILAVSESGSFRRTIPGLLDGNLFAVNVIAYGELDPVAIQKNSPDVVLLDCEERISIACNSLRFIQNYSEVPVIVLLEDRHTENTYKEFDGLSADGFLVKPLTQVLLEGYIRAKLRRILHLNNIDNYELAVV